jgi:hypothetical protein
MSDFKKIKEMESQLDNIRHALSNNGSVSMIVIRPETNERAVTVYCDLDLVGDNWQAGGDKYTDDGSSDLDRQLTIMNVRAVTAITNSEDNWPLAGDQFYVDFNLSDDNLSPGSQLSLGDAVVEVTALPHLGCGKFGNGFGKDANMFVNSELGKSLNLRGINARRVKSCSVAHGDTIRKL